MQDLNQRQSKQSLNMSLMSFLFVITFPFTINEVGAVSSLDFNVTIDCDAVP